MARPSDAPLSCVILDPGEDGGSLHAKLDEVPPGRVILVVPGDVTGMRSPVMARVLARFVQSYSGQAFIAVQDGGAAAALATSGVRVHRSLRGSGLKRQEIRDLGAALRAQKRPARWVGWNGALEAVGAFAVLVILLALVAIPLAVFLPSARVVLPIQAQPVEETQELRLVASPQVPAGGLRAERIQVRFRVVTEMVRPQDGASGAATGNVALVNQTAQGIRLQAGTEVGTAGPERFRLLEDVSLAPNAGAIASVRATQPGPAGNVAAGRVTRFMDAGLNSRVSVTNLGAFTGGGEGGGPLVTDEDYRVLRSDAARDTAAQVLPQLVANVKPGYVLVEESVASGIASERFSHGIGEAADSLRLEVEGVAAAWTYDAEALRRAMLATFEQRGISGRLVAPMVEVVAVQSSVGGEDTRVAVVYRAGVLPVVDTGAIRSRLAGAELDEAFAIASTAVPLRAPPQVEPWPEFLPVMPLMPWRIEVVVLDQQG